MKTVIPVIDWSTLMPVIIVCCTGIVGLLIEMFRPKRNNNAIVGISLVGLILAAISVIPQFASKPGPTFADMAIRDLPGLILQLILIGICFVAFLFSEPYLRQKRIAFGEFYPLALWATAGGMIMVATTNLLMQFIGLEVLSIALYCLAGMSRQEQRSEESALKYFLLGAFASGFLLYGIAFVYGASGQLDLNGFTEALQPDDPTINNLATFGLGLILVGLGFKTSLVPFHQWTPDVYQGAPTNVTGFMAAASKVAAFGALYRVLDAAMPLRDTWFPVLFWIAIATMTIGNLIALTQTDVKRALGYSSIANAGYILVALLAHYENPAEVPLTTTLYFLLTYSLMTLGAFAVISLTAKDGKEGTRFQDLNGLWKRAPYAAGALVLFMASLIGVPPTAGFFGKWFIFSDALKADLVPLAVVLAVNSVISVYYYLGIIRAAFVDDEPAVRPQTSNAPFGLTVACTICVVGIAWATFDADGLMKRLAGTGMPVAEVIYRPNEDKPELRPEARDSIAAPASQSAPAGNRDLEQARAAAPAQPDAATGRPDAVGAGGGAMLLPPAEGETVTMPGQSAPTGPQTSRG